MSLREPNHILKKLGRELNVAGALITAVMVAAIAWLHWGPLSRDMDESAERLATLQALLEDESRVRGEHAELRQQLDKATIEEAAILKRIPRNPQEAEFLAQLSQAAGNVGLQITDYRPGMINAGKLCSKQRVELACAGNYQAICTLLDRLQELPRYSTVIRLEIGPGALPEHYSAKLCLELYYLSDGRNLAAK
jgi:Tfp pilus assembly protein PilO